MNLQAIIAVTLVVLAILAVLCAIIWFLCLHKKLDNEIKDQRKHVYVLHNLVDSIYKSGFQDDGDIKDIKEKQKSITAFVEAMNESLVRASEAMQEVVGGIGKNAKSIVDIRRKIKDLEENQSVMFDMVNNVIVNSGPLAVKEAALREVTSMAEDLVVTCHHKVKALRDDLMNLSDSVAIRFDDVSSRFDEVSAKVESVTDFVNIGRMG